jgi:6-pyruvoyltetrahydropterin/6-carboxytetrahydropterin synthase
MRHHLVKILHFEAAHRNLLGGAKEKRLHGHSYKVEVLASGAPDPAIGWVVDFAELKRLCKPILQPLDHAYLNEVPGLEADSTLPALERWILTRIQPRPPWLDGLRVSIVGDLCLKLVRLSEDEFEHLPERIRFTFEAAQSLPQLPAAHPCSRLHGHSYRIEAGAANLDELAYRLPELYAELDHQYLNEIPGLEHSTVEHIARWIWNWLDARQLRPTAVVVQETNTSRCVCYGE